MNNILKNSFIYYKKINNKILIFLLLILSVVTINQAYSLDSDWIVADSILSLPKNGWDLYASVYSYSSLLSIVFTFISLYFTFVCFGTKGTEYYIQIREKNKFKWFFSKVTNIFSFNLILISLHSLLIIIIGSIINGIGFTWSEFGEQMWAYSMLYSPLRIVILNIITYTFFISFLSEIIGLFIIQFEKRSLVFSGVIIYLIIDSFSDMINQSLSKILKYVSVNNYINFGNRTFFLNQEGLSNAFTVKQGVIYPLILFTITTFLIFLKLNKKNSEEMN